jgi:hypothetical protein
MKSLSTLGLSVIAWTAAADATPRSLAPEPVPLITGQLRRWTRVRVERCRHGDPEGCREAAYAFRVGGDGVTRDHLTAQQLYVRAWSLRTQRTEQDLLPLYEMRVNTPSERAYLLDVCTQGGGYACATVGIYDLWSARTRRAKRAALDLIVRGRGCPQVSYEHFCVESGRDLRREHRWYFQSQ